jgi:hypothetical protein
LGLVGLETEGNSGAGPASLTFTALFFAIRRSVYQKIPIIKGGKVARSGFEPLI